MAAGPRRDGDTAPGMPDGKDPPGRDSCRQRSGPTRPGPGPARLGTVPAGSAWQGRSERRGQAQPRASVLPSFPPRWLCRNGSGTRAPAGACPSPGLAFCLWFCPEDGGIPDLGETAPCGAAGTGSPSWASEAGAEWPGLGDGSSSTPGSSEAPKERPDFHRVPHPALLNKTRRSKTHK